MLFGASRGVQRAVRATALACGALGVAACTGSARSKATSSSGGAAGFAFGGTASLGSGATPLAALTTDAAGSTAFGLIALPDKGLRDGTVAASLIGGVAVLALFVRHEMRTPAPMMPTGLFRSRGLEPSPLGLGLDPAQVHVGANEQDCAVLAEATIGRGLARVDRAHVEPDYLH